MVKFKLVSENTPNIQEILNEYFPPYTSTEDNFFVKRIEREDCRITIYITEEYYFRINSDLTLTVIVEETKNETTVEVVCSGGKIGLLSFSHVTLIQEGFL